MRLHPGRLAGWLVVAVLFNLSCEHADPLGSTGPDPDEPTMTAIQENIFNQSCAVSGCHAGSSAPLGLDLSEGAAYDNLVNVASREVPDLLRIDPGDPDASYLVMKITGAAGIVGGRMPLGRTPLSQDQIDLVAEWVRLGAHDN